MYLTSTSIAAWLIQRGLLNPAAVTAGQFAVQEIERHNRGFRVYRPLDRPLFVKQLRVFDAPNVECLKKEAAFGDAFSRCGSIQWLTSHVPDFLDYDIRHHAVTVQLLPDTINLHEHVERSTAMPDSVASELGELIAAFHSTECDELLSMVDAEHLPGNAPWILSFHRNQGAGSLSPQNEQLLNVLHCDLTLCAHLDELRDAWQATSLMHGDLKWTNVLVGVEASEDWHVIDWEMADRGDPLWDLATMVQCWWAYWVLSTPPQQLTELDELRQQRNGAFTETRRSLDALWSAYYASLGLCGHSRARTHERLIRMAAARLLQTVYELLNSGETSAHYVELLVEIARRLLSSPDSMQELNPGATL